MKKNILYGLCLFIMLVSSTANFARTLLVMAEQQTYELNVRDEWTAHQVSLYVRVTLAEDMGVDPRALTIFTQDGIALEEYNDISLGHIVYGAYLVARLDKHAST